MKIGANFWLAKQTSAQKTIRDGLYRQILTKVIPEFVCAAHQLVKDQFLLAMVPEITLPVIFSSSQVVTTSFVSSLLRLREGRENHGLMETTSAGTTPGPKSFAGSNRTSIRSEDLINVITGEFIISFVHGYLAYNCKKELLIATSLLKSVKSKHPRINAIVQSISRITCDGAWRIDARANESHYDCCRSFTLYEEILRNDLDSLVQCTSGLKKEIWDNAAQYQCMRSMMLGLPVSACCHKALCKTWLLGPVDTRHPQSTTGSGTGFDSMQDETIDDLGWSLKSFQLRPHRPESLIIPSSNPKLDSKVINAEITIIVRNERHVCWSLRIPNWLGSATTEPFVINSQDCSLMNFLISQDFYRFAARKKTSSCSRPALYCLRGLELRSTLTRLKNKAQIPGASDLADFVNDDNLLCLKALERLTDLDSKLVCCFVGAELSRIIKCNSSSCSRRRNNSFEQYMNFWCTYFALDLEGMTRICSENNLFGVSNFTEVSIDYIKQIEAEARVYRVLNQHRQLCLTPRPLVGSMKIKTTQAILTEKSENRLDLSIEQEIANFAHHAMCPTNFYLPRLSAQIGCFLYKGLMCARNISIHTSQYESFKNKFHGQPDVVYGFLKTKIRVKPNQILLIRAAEYAQCLGFLATLFLKPSACSLDIWLKYSEAEASEPSDIFSVIQMDACVLTGTQEFYLNVFLQHQTMHKPDPELIILLCKFLWMHRISNKKLASEIRHLLSGLRKEFQNVKIIRIIEYLIQRKFKETCIISYLIYERTSSTRQINPGISLTQLAEPQLPQSSVLLNLFVNYIRKYGRIGSRRIQLEKINRLINSSLVQMKTTMKTNESLNAPLISPQTFHENVVTACCEVLKEYIIPHLDMIHAAAGFCEIKKSILALEDDLNHDDTELDDSSPLPGTETTELIRLIKSVDLDNLRDLGDKVYQVAKVGSSYELLRTTVLNMARFIDKRLAKALQGFIASITLLPAVYTQILIALILQYIQKLDETNIPINQPKHKRGANGKLHEPVVTTEIADTLNELSTFFKEILTTQLSRQEKNSSFVTEGLKTIKSIVLDAIEGCRHIHRSKKEKSSSLSTFFQIMDTQLLINVCIENGCKQRAIMLCEEYLSGDYGNVSFYSQYPLTYYKTFKTNRDPEVNIYSTGDDISINVWEICTYLMDNTAAHAQERWQNEVDNYCDSIAERLKVVSDSRNHTSAVYEVESGRLTQLCGTLCAEDVLRLNDWSAITCIWDTVLLLPLKYLCQQAKACQADSQPFDRKFSLLALPQTGLEISDAHQDPHNDLTNDDTHFLCPICELCKNCDCFCLPTSRPSTYSQSALPPAQMHSRNLRVKGQLGLINALGILGHSAAISETLEPLRLNLLKGRFNSHTLVHQWVVAYETREAQPRLLDQLIRDLSETFEELKEVHELNINDRIEQLVCEQDVLAENQFLEISELALNLRKPPEKVDNIDNNYYESIEIIRCFPNHIVFRLEFAHQLFQLIHEELYERTVAERAGCEKPLDLIDQPLNSITRMSLGEMMLRCMEEYLVCATLDDDASMTCILRWLCLLCAIPSSDCAGSTVLVIDGLVAAKNELSSRFSVAHINLIANVPVRVWFSILPQLVCRSTLLIVGQSVFVPLIARLLIVFPHQTLWYLAQLWASTRLRYRGASEAILASTHRLLTTQEDPLELALAMKIGMSPQKADISQIKTMWINMKKWTELLTQAAEDTRIPPGECALNSIYPAIAGFKLESILMPIKRTLWIGQHIKSPTILQCWKERYSNMRCATVSALFQSPSQSIAGLSLPILYLENFEIPTTVLWMRGLNNRVVVYRSKQRPKRICSLGCDGNLYHFLLKFEGTGDLRKDARVEEIVNSTNESLPPSISTRSITFIVLCLKELSGIIEWVCGVSVLKDCLKDPLSGGSGKSLECDQRLRFTARPKQSEYGTVLKNYVELGLMRYPPVLHKWFLISFGDSSSHWLTARTHFVESLAIWNCIGYVMGLGDRHSENILISSLTGHITHVDFDCLFDKGQVKLTIPEVVPFRMTPNIVTACGSSYGLLRKNMIDVMNLSLKNRSVDFQAILHTFVSDPAVEWSNKKDIQVLNHVQWKIQGKLNHSCHFTKLAKQNPKGDRYRLATKVPRPSNLPVWSHRRLPTEVFVDLLLECAQDKLNLALMYFGWSPWL